MKFSKNLMAIAALVAVATFSSVQPSAYIAKAKAAAEKAKAAAAQAKEAYAQAQDVYNQAQDVYNQAQGVFGKSVNKPGQPALEVVRQD